MQLIVKFSFVLLLPFALAMKNGSTNSIGHKAIQKEVAVLPFSIVFYNVENLFYPANDSLTNDDDFTPGGTYHWTFKRYYDKIRKIGKTIIAISGDTPPAIIGLCEIENRKVLTDLLEISILSKLNYRIIHKDSPDLRGIDVALMYDPAQFNPINYEVINIHPNKDEPYFITRDILHVTGKFTNGTVGHFFVNHWPSRRGGALESSAKREKMATILKNTVSDIMGYDSKARIVIMGDFNDEPVDLSILEKLNAKPIEEMPGDTGLVNLMYSLYKNGEGTHFRKNNFIEASLLDQFIVSKSLFCDSCAVGIAKESAEIYKNPILINEKNGLPLRTYQGLKYLGGFSDHFPIYLKLLIFSENEN